MPTVTVVIPTRNRLRFLMEAVASIDRQTFDDLEVVVVDDASDDGTAEWLASNSALRRRTVRLDRAVERSIARNRGLEEAAGAFVLFLDDDDRLLPTAIATLTSALQDHPSGLAAVGAYVSFDDLGNRRRALHPRRLIEGSLWRDALFHWVATPSRSLFRSDVVRTVGGFRAGAVIGGDWDLTLRITSRGPVVVVPQVVTEYRIHPGQTPPSEQAQAIEVIAAEHTSVLDGPRAAEAVRINEARRRFFDGSAALSGLEAGRALRAFLGAIRSDRALLRSPIARPLLVRSLAKAAVLAVFGGRATLLARRARKTIRRRLRRDAWRAEAISRREDRTV